MSTAISVLGGIGLFLLGMTIMTDGLKGLAGSALRTVLGKAAATPVSGAFWGAIVTLLVQSSSATTMTTIGLVSAGLLTFPQGLGLVLGANVGTTGTAWLVALIGVRVSLSTYALPMIFAGALAKLVGSGRISAAGASLAGFALVLYGLTTLQQGMSGVAAQMHPSDLPAVLGAPGVSWLQGWAGLLSLVLAGLLMTAVMQSSTAAIAVTLSAFYAGAVGLDQACGLIIGQNIGTATSSALAAIGASTTAKRLALAYVLFKLIAAVIALLFFRPSLALIGWGSQFLDGVTLLAAYHTAYNVVGVMMVLPLINSFTRFVEMLLPDRRSPLTRALDPAALANPVVAVEAVRRTAALSIERIAKSIETAISSAAGAKGAIAMSDAIDALREAQAFIAEVKDSPVSQEERHRLMSTLRGLDRASRLVEIAREEPDFPGANDGLDEVRAAALCAEAMRNAVSVASGIGHEAALSEDAEPIDTLETASASLALAKLEGCAQQLRELRRNHRAAALHAAAGGDITADQAMARIETVRRLEALTRHTARAVANLLGHDGAVGTGLVKEG